jgi:antitoxin HigA-1
MEGSAMIEIVATLEPMHPGEMLREEFIVPLGLSAGKIAAAAGVPRTRIERIVKEEIGVTADTALRLGKVLNTTPDFWMTLQARYDLQTAQQEISLDDVKPLVAA